MVSTSNSYCFSHFCGTVWSGWWGWNSFMHLGPQLRQVDLQSLSAMWSLSLGPAHLNLFTWWRKSPAAKEGKPADEHWWLALCVNLMGPRVPRYLVKHYSGYVCEGVWDEADLWIVSLNKEDYPPQCGWASSNSLEDWLEKKVGWVSVNLLFAWLVSS